MEEKIIEIQEEIQVGDIILEKGDKIQVVSEGVGYELYAKGADRVVAQCQTIANAAEGLADAVRKNKSLNIKKKFLKEMGKYFATMAKEIKQLEDDVDNLEGYKD